MVFEQLLDGAFHTQQLAIFEQLTAGSFHIVNIPTAPGTVRPWPVNSLRFV